MTWHSVHNDKSVVLAWNLGHDLRSVELTLSAHSETTTAHIVNVLHSKVPLSDQVRLLDSLGSYDKLTSILVASMSEICLESLLFGAHQLAHSGLVLSDDIVIGLRTAVDIKHDKLELLHLLKEVGNREACGEIRVQVIFNGLSLSNLNPSVLLEFEQLALRV